VVVGHLQDRSYAKASPSGTAMFKGQAFGGYITTKNGKHLVYQLVVNNVPTR
jgi:D-alanyl-D-alanine carboxypeptidase